MTREESHLKSLQALQEMGLKESSITAVKHIPAQEGRFADYPAGVSSRLLAALQKKGYQRLYSHQRTSWESLQGGGHIVVVTPTASGKTLCYNLPVLNAILNDPASRAIYLFPTKALSQDQSAELDEIIGLLPTITDGYKGSLRNPDLFQSPIFSLSLFYEMRCRNRDAVSLFGQSVESLKNAGDQFDTPEDRLFIHAVLGTILAHLGMHHAYLLQYRQAEELLEDAIRLLENSSAIMANAYALITVGWLLQIQGEIKKSIIILEKILVIFQDGGDTWGYILASAQLAFGFFG